MTLLPVAPLLLLPFLLIFFVAVFPFWLLAILVLLPLRALIRRVAPDRPIRTRVDKTFRWVATFGGLVDWETG